MKFKKFIAIIITTITTVCIFIGFSGCDNYVDELSEEKSLEIRTAYYNQYPEKWQSIDDIIICDYCGEYNGVYVVDICEGIVIQVIFTEIIDGVTFKYPVPDTLDVYYNGNFYKLQEAFDLGLLTHDNLVEINNRRK